MYIYIYDCLRSYHTCTKLLVMDDVTVDDERKEAVKADSLLPMLAQLKDSSYDVQFQALRAIGNLCYEYGTTLCFNMQYIRAHMHPLVKCMYEW